MRVLRFVPAILSVIVLAAHFLRDGSMVVVALTLLSPLLMLIPTRLGVRLFQGVLLFGFAEWVRTSWLLASMRDAAGMPWTRMAIILGSVALFTLISVILLEPIAQRRRSAEGMLNAEC